MFGVLLLTALCGPLNGPQGVSAQEMTPVVDQGEQLLVLFDGRVIKGRISLVTDGYLLELSSGQVAVPFENVICQARTLPEAYRLQRDGMTKPTADQHIALANWCLQQKLLEEAERELNSALKLQPDHQVAKRLAEQLINRKPKNSDFINQEQQQHRERLIIEQTFSTAKPIGGIEASLAEEFATKIEMLLINSCANTSCHGSQGENSFRLTHKWNVRGNTRHITDQNLRAVLEQIDTEHPEQSPLLTVLQQPHGPRKTAVLTGAQARQQQQMLTRWALQVARTQGPPTKKPASGAGAIQQVGFAEAQTERSSSEEPKSTPAPAAMLPEPGRIHPDGVPLEMEPEQSGVDALRQKLRHDPFDPAIFNRIKHGR